ncbi:MAG: TonB-dependent receptor [Undibacterium sp.]|uniref:TonB-dependent receptor plug domain-containing protein n=1 Tax=Undibacterium sp. TaxID=1914977 RepID=UPI00271742ED|nr:TonB-dependent receptor [Undibacterium sp.]MDO8651048.1 TonB-dependent receptor [Undibacterium sp.]
MVEKIISRSVRLMFVGGVAMSAGLLALPAVAQEVQRVEVTGSSIKRIAAEGALPVTVINAEAIKASGVTSAVDLVKKLSSVQGSTGESASVGGSSFGFSGISIHNIGETRTLVLLNGKRLAQFGGQTLTGFAAGFDLNSLPLSAIERVELLTDGASAIYGADAIGGVVNFITKRNSTEGDVTIGYSRPADGAQEKRFSATKGFGSLEQDGYNVMLTFGHDERTQLNSTDRSFAKTGKVDFLYNGKQYRKQQFSASPIPANATDDLGQLISPYLKTNGKCPAKTFRVTEPYPDGSGVDDYCGFDFVGELEIYPERKRDSFMASATTKLGGQELYADVLLSRTNQISRIAPVPGAISIPAGSALHDTYLKPLGITGDSLAYYRLFDMGKRTSDDTAEFISIGLGARGELSGWDYNAGYNHSASDVKGNISGYPGALAVKKLRASGLLDPFVGPGQQSAAAKAAIAAASYSGYWDGGVSKLDTVNLNGSREITRLPGGPLMFGAGLNFNREAYESKPSLFRQGKLADPVAGTLCDGTTANPCDQRFGDAASAPTYSASRHSTGLFGELIMPVTKTLELGTALRVDNYSDFGNATTAKANFRWTPTSTVLIRGSVGNGFHAPTVPQVNAALQGYGVTSEKYLCTPELQAVATAHGAICQSGNRQYDQIAGGNPNLQPEKSKQATLGIRFEPSSSYSFGVDIWHVQISEAFGQLTEQLVFANPGNFTKSWGTQVDIGTGKNYLAFLADNQNLGKSFSTGLDFDFSARMKTSLGLLSSQLTMTHMLREVSQLEKNGKYYSAIGDFSDLGTVTFRNQGRLSTSLKTANWINTLAINFKSGYKDQETSVDTLDAAGVANGTEQIRMKVGYYTTLDWQTVWNPSKNWSISGGVLNLLDNDPPFVVSTSGSNRGQQFGYDDRYYDSRGRTVYVNASYKF